ncbi:AAA family ATPase [Paraburkholderia panacisoli]|uniref:AAA family ATPase n=1 Tax=Paraburkholderia panacisoli TaxID=2603818 RepID=A0A5B0GLZ1_9BURK|nr:AAA family ATPase [Paraburkholderia panacisoli]KAA1004332.1 AAA family ATPase [Paraburkholderia panacisoli]
MATAKQDFEHFVRRLYEPDRAMPADVRRLAILCLQNFDELAATTRQRSQRSITLVRLIRESLPKIADVAPAPAAQAAAGAWGWKRLRNFTLGPFRGFRNPETFDLTKQVVLFYGPNGSGKTSLCEGLEYALLGEVEEAGAKRIVARTYLANLHAGRFVDPVLTATDHQGGEINVAPNPDTYRFCFVEKNRIDSFSRIAARPPAQRAELIATLFGMDQFSDFVGNFNENIDGQLVLTDNKQKALAAQRATLATDQQTVKGEAESLRGLDAEEAELGLEYAAGTTYEMLKQLIGSEAVPGRLHALNAILERVPPSIIGVTRRGLVAAFDKSNECQSTVDEHTAALRARSEQVSFKGLYDAVVALKESVGDRCPACDTPLAGPVQVATNPYEKASAGLKQLEELGTLQEKQRAAQREVDHASGELREMLGRVSGFLASLTEKPTALTQFLALLPPAPAGAWWAGIFPKQPAQPANPDVQQELFAIVERMEAQDAASQQAQQNRKPDVDERRRLEDFRLRVQAQDQKRQTLKDNVAAANKRIEAFDVANAQLIAEAEQERLAIARDTPLKGTYDRFLEELRSYRDHLPGQLMAGLNETALNLYNDFNRNDLDADKLAALHLPLTDDGKIEVTFRGDQDRRVDALHVLSEGHIRCLGLAILLAKAKSIDSPTIVFDDAINAIDHDHRGGIREAIFESDTFADTQIVVTCHSNEFIKDIQQHMPRERDSQVYLFRHHTGDHHPRVSGNVPTANYVAKARAARDVLNDREALSASRQALEMLTEKVWRWLGTHDLGTLSVPLAGVGAEPALRNLCEALRKKLHDAGSFNHANKEITVGALERILGIPGTSLIWTYLNKGTHEEADRDDFDGEQVEAVVRTLEELRDLDLRKGK